MKFIIAVIKPHMLDKVREALDDIGVVAMSVTDVGGMGRQRGQTEIYRGAEYKSTLLPKVKIEIAAPSDKVQPIVETIQHAAATGAIGDGKIFVIDLGDAIRIRTGESGRAAL